MYTAEKNLVLSIGINNKNISTTLSLNERIKLVNVNEKQKTNICKIINPRVNQYNPSCYKS